jgi:hypothetical protein
MMRGEVWWAELAGERLFALTSALKYSLDIDW